MIENNKPQHVIVKLVRVIADMLLDPDFIDGNDVDLDSWILGKQRREPLTEVVPLVLARSGGLLFSYPSVPVVQLLNYFFWPPVMTIGQDEASEGKITARTAVIEGLGELPS